MSSVPVKVKVCGLFREEDVGYVNAAMPDYIGFVFAESKRKVNAEQAARLRRNLAPGIVAVGVFVNERREIIADICSRGIIDIVQLHGNEPPEYVAALKSTLPKGESTKIISANGAENADYLLFDSPVPGSGQTFDWSEIRNPGNLPIFLAGGLNPGNVAAAIAQVRPFAVDVSSGVETNGVKDGAKIREFTEIVRALG